MFANACSKVGEGAKKKEKKNVSVGFNTNSQPKSLKESPVVSSIPKESNSVHQTDQQKCCIKEATEKLKDVARGTKVFEVPEGEPLFLSSYAVGKTRPLTIFYDKGCSHVVLREGLPNKELNAVMTRKGPLTINGVGDTLVRE